MRRFLIGAYLALCTVALVWPGYALFGARVEPRLLGVPFSLVWVIGWLLATFVALGAYHLTRPEGR